MDPSRPHPSDWAGRLGVQQALQLRQAKTLLVQVVDGGHGRVGLGLLARSTRRWSDVDNPKMKD